MGLTRIGSLLLFSTVAVVCLVGMFVEGAHADDPPALVWEARYNQPYSEDWGKAVVTDGAGNIYVTGTGYGYLGSPDFVTVKYDPTGTEVWKAHYGSYSYDVGCYPFFHEVSDVPVAIGLDGAGNVYVTGTSAYCVFCPVHYTICSTDSVTVKYDPDGNELWAETSIGGPAAGMAVDEAGNVYVTGTQYFCDEYGACSAVSYVTVKFDTFGQKHWSVTYEGPPTGEYNSATDIALDGLGLIHVTGRSQGTGTGYDYATITYGPHGTELDVNRYDGPAGGDDKAESIFVNTLGEVYVTGSSEGTGTDKDFATVKYDWFGSQVWVARYNGPPDGSDEAVSLVGDHMGNVFVTGTSEGLASGTDIVTIAYDALGYQIWEQRYDGPASGSDSASSVTITSSGDVVVTGESEGTGSAEDYVTIRYGSSSGAEQWTARYDGPANGEDGAASVAGDGSGNVIVTGHSQGIKTGQDYATVKYDAGGSELWAARFENPGMGGSYDAPAAMALDPSGNICVTGSSGEPYYGYGTAFDYATVKVDLEGNELWTARYDGPAGGRDQAYDLAVDAAGNIHVTGSSEGSGTEEDYLTIKYDPAGSELWVARYDGTGNAYDVATDLAVDAGGNVCVTGTSEGAGTGKDYLTIKYDPAGSELWVARYDAASYKDEAYDLNVDVAGNVYVTGYITDVGTGEDYATVKYDPAGNELWVARYDGPTSSTDKAYDLTLDASGNVYVTGYSKGAGASYDYDYATVKYDAAGNELWVARYNGPANSNDRAVALVLDASGNVYVTGYSAGTAGPPEAATIKYAPDGNELWVVRYSGPSEENVYISTIKMDASGSTYIAGSISGYYDYYPYDLYRQEYLMVKYDTLGNMEWEVLYDGPHIMDEGEDTAVALVLDDSGNMYVTGYSEFQGTSLDFATIKYTHDLTCNDPDGDGYGAPGSPECTYPERDCDNTDPDVNPGDPEDDWEECHNGIDDDCDGFADFLCTCDDSDGDGYGEPDEAGACAYPEEDCDDTNPAVNPGHEEVPGNGIDDDCDGEVDEVDCFIATAAFGSEMGGRIEVLRDFRDQVLMGIPAGRAFVKAYYKLSPPVADFIAKRGWLRVLVRTLLLPLIGAASLVV